MTPVQPAIGDSRGRAKAGRSRAAALFATASLLTLLSQMPRAAAQDCAAAGAPPDGITSPAALYETVRDRTDAQLLAIAFLQRPVAAACTWIYEVKLLTSSGAVVELDLSASDLGLIGARGPDNDREVTKLVRGFGGDTSTIITGTTDSDRQRSGKSGPGASGSGSGGHSGPGGGGGEGGEGGNSGSGSGSSGGGDDGGEGGDSGGGDGDGGDGGEGGEGGGDD